MTFTDLPQIHSTVIAYQAMLSHLCMHRLHSHVLSECMFQLHVQIVSCVSGLVLGTLWWVQHIHNSQHRLSGEPPAYPQCICWTQLLQIYSSFNTLRASNTQHCQLLPDNMYFAWLMCILRCECRYGNISSWKHITSLWRFTLGTRHTKESCTCLWTVSMSRSLICKYLQMNRHHRSMQMSQCMYIAS